MQYLILKSILKKGKLQTPQPNKSYQLFLDSSDASNLIANVKTDASGSAKAFLPVLLKEKWAAKSSHTFIVKAGDEELITDYSISKAKITIDTASSEGIKSITVTVLKQDGSEWLPAPDVEMKVGIQRLGGVLSAGDEETYTTDSSGSVTVEVKKDNLPGDNKGNIILIAKAEENDLYGNLQIEKAAPWGIKQTVDSSFFNKRTLWSTRFRTPFWLLFIAYSIVLSVWGTLIYLIFQLIKIKKLGIKSTG
jgi:hypothetical protein